MLLYVCCAVGVRVCMIAMREATTSPRRHDVELWNALAGHLHLLDRRARRFRGERGRDRLAGRLAAATRRCALQAVDGADHRVDSLVRAHREGLGAIEAQAAAPAVAEDRRRLQAARAAPEAELAALAVLLVGDHARAEHLLARGEAPIASAAKALTLMHAAEGDVLEVAAGMAAAAGGDGHWRHGERVVLCLRRIHGDKRWRVSQ